MWLSITGMYEYDNSIFDGLDIPTYTDQDNTIHVINKQTVIDNICLKYAELEILYTSIATMKLAIGVWSAANQESWYKLIETQFIKYNPIWNVDADETEKLQHGHTETRTLDYDDTTTRGTTETTTRGTTDTTSRGTTETTTRGTTDTTSRGTTETTTRGTTETRTPNLTDTQRPNTTDTESVKGFNSNTWSEAKKVDNSGYATYEQHGTESIAHSGIDTVANSGNDTITHTGVDTVANSGNDTITHTGVDTLTHTGVDTLSHDGTDTMAHTGIDTTTRRRTGNIGVTTTQKMINEQREVAEFNIIDYIAESFKNRFCLLIY